MDLGLDGCQPWPVTLQLTSPYAYGGVNIWPNYGGPPTDFTGDASGIGVQPSVDSSGWRNLLTVKSFTPPLFYGTNGIFSHSFQILPQDDSPTLQGSPLEDLQLSLSDSIGTNLSINVEAAFPLQRTCCPTFTAKVRARNATIEALPSWLSLTYGFVPNVMPIFEDVQSVLDVGVALKLTGYPGVDAVGSYTILITATSADQPPVQTTKSLTLMVRPSSETIRLHHAQAS